jgi:hypothetical protein
MSEVLLKAPRLWSTLLNPQSFSTLAQFQTAIKYHEDLLIEFGERYEKVGHSSSRSYRVDTKSKEKKPFKKKDSKSKTSRNYAVGGNSSNRTPAYPKDDSNVSKGKTPADYGARGCIFCGSTKHWDRECKYNKGNDALKKARAMFVDYSPEELQEEADYNLHYAEEMNNQGSSSESDQSESSPEQSSENQEETGSSEDSDF